MADAGKILITPKGSYSTTAAYEVLDLINHKGKSWIAKQDVIGIEPSEANSEYWFKMAGPTVANDLTITEEGYVLDARQGKLLLDEIANTNSNLAKEISERKAEIAVERARIDAFTKLEEGSTTGDAELIDARVGADAVPYANVGEAIRTQFANVKSDLSELDNDTSCRVRAVHGGNLEMKYGYYHEGNGTLKTDDNYMCTDILPFKKEAFIFNGTVVSWNTYFALFNDATFVGIYKVREKLFYNANSEVIEEPTYNSCALCFFAPHETLTEIFIENAVNNATKLLELTPINFTFVHDALININAGNYQDLDGWTRTTFMRGNTLPLFYTDTDIAIYAVLFKDGCYVGCYDYSKAIWKAFNTDNTLSDVDKVDFDMYVLEYFSAEELIHPVIETHWNGKKAVLIGDSITVGTYTPYGGGSMTRTKSYPLRATEKLGMSVTNYAINGISISSTSTQSPTYAISLIYSAMADDADLVLVCGGTNDYGTNVVLGTEADTTDVSFYGALYVLMNGLSEKYPQKTVVFVTPVNRVNEDNANTAGFTLEQYREAIRKRAREFGFKCIDGTELGVHCKNATYASVNVVDGTHLNPQAHITVSNTLANMLKAI